MARGELHVQLYINYADDPKLADVSRDARLLYVDMLCAAKRTLNDGVFTRAQMRKVAFPLSSATADKRAAELVGSGALLLADDGSFTIGAWLKRNKSKAQIAADQAAAEEAALLGNHKRWHAGKGKSEPDCKWCIEDAANAKEAS